MPSREPHTNTAQSCEIWDDFPQRPHSTRSVNNLPRLLHLLASVALVSASTLEHHLFNTVDESTDGVMLNSDARHCHEDNYYLNDLLATTSL
jgi:hypothetical protein